MFNKLYSNIKNYIKNNRGFLITIFLILVIFNISVPYGIYAPGGLINANERLNNIKYNIDGTYNLTYVSYYKAKLPTLLYALLNKEWDIISNKDLIMENETLEDADKRDKISLKESVSNAIYVATTFAGNPLNIEKTDNYVFYIDEIANTNLKVGDLLVSYDDIEFDNFNNFKKYIELCEINDEIKIKVIRNNKEIECFSKVTILNEEKKIGIMIKSVNTYSDEINYSYKNSEAGSSGGLMMSLAIYDSITEEDLSKGKKICGTGTIDIDGNTGEIGGIKYKLLGAVKNECDVFLIDSNDYEEAQEIAKEHNYNIPVVSIDKFETAVNYLKNS